MRVGPAPITALATLLLTLAALVLPAGGAAADEKKPPVEFGAVEWLRTIEAGEAAAKERKRPMLVLFQEVPG